eukprot:CAMPEP_0175474674 /NCGR_PEP_ID=MMETSP0095-20121207/75015_1 /TAXON_ID=311494 /ORGANISM="Alexandrium monilatum, Strain CCMP3105" /LENGTH=94 /DNA_ID=CAMNT_0016776201 /DNA_START=30 /DNA_END=310 /DNA_ORIENTATION=-
MRFPLRVLICVAGTASGHPTTDPKPAPRRAPSECSRARRTSNARAGTWGPASMQNRLAGERRGRQLPANSNSPSAAVRNSAQPFEEAQRRLVAV